MGKDWKDIGIFHIIIFMVDFCFPQLRSSFFMGMCPNIHISMATIFVNNFNNSYPSAFKSNNPWMFQKEVQDSFHGLLLFSPHGPGPYFLHVF